MATPLIRIPQEQGGTMYAFSSAARDLTRAYYNPDINFEYSKFALIDIPVVSDPGSSGANFIQFDNLYEGGLVPPGGQAPSYTPDGNANVDFAQTLQNYALNFENFILTDDDFDNAIYSTDAEKILFKWLHHLGAFEVQNANSQQVVSGYSRAIEIEDTTNTGNEYSRVVKYIGNIDVSNDKNYQGNTYNEIFVNVPSSVGYTPEILFKSTPYNTTATTYQPNSEINGRGGQTHPDAFLNLESIADNDNGTISLDQNSYNFGIEWNSTLYSKIATDPKLNNFVEFSKRGGDFRFNAILLYYDLYSKSNIVNKSTNLYGILILDNFKNDPNSTGWYIPELTKYKPNDVTGLNGNAFALKLNVKFNSSLDNVGVELNINDYSTFSMDIFLDTTTALENAAKLLVEAGNSYAAIAQRVGELENLVSSSTSTDFSQRIAALETALEDASLNYASSTSILDMITSVNTRLNQIISGVIPTEIQYNTNVLNAGNGMKIDKSNPNMIKIVNDNNGYTLNPVFNYEFLAGTTGTLISPSNLFNLTNTAFTGLITRIKPFDNLIRINTDTGTMSGDLNIYLDDSINSWKNGQTIKFSFKNQLPNLGTYKINIFTDKNKGYVLKASIDVYNILSQKPYFELICVDEINKTFELEIIR
jgi:hypothetical protein